jgi:hypothetical protein
VGNKPNVATPSAIKIKATRVAITPIRNLPMRPPGIFWQSGGIDASQGIDNHSWERVAADREVTELLSDSV